MFLCCCVRLHRHQLHLASYGFVSMSLIVTGFVFTVFAVFHRDAQIEPSAANSAGGSAPAAATITTAEENDDQNELPWDWIGRSRLGKIWLAGPVLMVVGGVLCGKVMIDWGPAMARGRTGSLDSQLMDELVFANLLPIDSAAKAARSSLITMAHSAEPSKLMRTARFSCTSALSASSSVAAAASAASADHYLLASSTGGHGAIVIGTAGRLPDRHNLSCPLLSPSLPPPALPMCALYGSSSSASSINSQKNGGYNFDRIIYGPVDEEEQQWLNANGDDDDGDEDNGKQCQRANNDGTRRDAIADDDAKSWKPENNGKGIIEDKKKNGLLLVEDKATQSERWADDAAGATPAAHFHSYGCERCATFWPILERKHQRIDECASSTTPQQQRTAGEEERPKVIGKFVFAQLLEQHQQTGDRGGGGRKSPNYGTILARDDDDTGDSDQQKQLLISRNNGAVARTERRSMVNVNEVFQQQQQQNNIINNSTRRASCSQGETLIINERSFLI